MSRRALASVAAATALAAGPVGKPTPVDHGRQEPEVDREAIRTLGLLDRQRALNALADMLGPAIVSNRADRRAAVRRQARTARREHARRSR